MDWVPRYVGVSPRDQCKLTCQARALGYYYVLEPRVRAGGPAWLCSHTLGGARPAPGWGWGHGTVWKTSPRLCISCPAGSCPVSFGFHPSPRLRVVPVVTTRACGLWGRSSAPFPWAPLPQGSGASRSSWTASPSGQTSWRPGCPSTPSLWQGRRVKAEGEANPGGTPAGRLPSSVHLGRCHRGLGLGAPPGLVCQI